LLVLTGKAKELAGKAGMGNMHVTLSHVKEVASAVVVVEKK
jgi:phosphopantetheinyl transferase (holo-ACP synthase)